MSYGFLAQQVPGLSHLAVDLGGAGRASQPWIGRTDLAKLTLRRATVIVGTPNSIGQDGDCQPSFDLPNALGNAIVASILADASRVPQEPPLIFGCQ